MTTITIRVNPTLQSNGSPITAYQVWRDQGNYSSDLTTMETSYDGMSSTFVLQNLTPGVKYRIAVVAANLEGDSD